MEQEIMEGLLEEASLVLLHYQDRDMREKLKYIVKKLLGRQVLPIDVIYWPTGLLANTLATWWSGQTEKETPLAKKVLAHLKEYFARWITEKMPVLYVDDVLCGNALLILFEGTGEKKYLLGAERMVAFLYGLEETSADKKGSLPYRPQHKNGHVYVDAIGMISPFLVRYGTVYGDKKAVRLGMQQLQNMKDYGMCNKTGLPYHGYAYDSKIKYGIIGWGRGVGWLLMAYAGVIESLEKKDSMRVQVEQDYCELVKRVLEYQRNDGSFSWQLGAEEGPADSSATAMIGCGIATGLAEGVFGQEQIFLGAVKNMAAYIRRVVKDNHIMNCSGECEGFARYPQVYGSYPWALGPGILLLYKETKQ